MFIDSHCHLNYKGLVEDQQAVLARAREAGVSAMLNISTRASEWDEVVGLAERDFTKLADTSRYARLAASGFTLEPPAPIFPRLELPAEA